MLISPINKTFLHIFCRIVVLKDKKISKKAVKLDSFLQFLVQVFLGYVGCFWKINLKETRNSYFCVTSKYHLLMFVSLNIKKRCHKKVSVCFYNLGEKTFKSSSFCNISVMVLFEICQRFKGHFLNEFRVSFNFVKPYHDELSSKAWWIWQHHIPQNIFFWKL